MKKFKFSVFLSLLLSIFFVQNAFAEELSVRVEKIQYSDGAPYCRYHMQPSNIWTSFALGSSSLAIGGNTGNNAVSVQGIQCKFTDGITVQAGTYIEAYVRAVTTAYPANSNQGLVNYSGTPTQLMADDSKVRGVSIEKVGEGLNQDSRWEIYKIVTYNNSTTDYVYIPLQYTQSDNLHSTTLKVFSWTNYQAISNGLSTDDRNFLDNLISNLPGGNIQAEANAEAMQDKTEEAMQDSKAEAESTAESAQQEAEAETQNLIQASTTIINAIKDAPTTDCNLRLDFGNLNLGNVNFCNAPSTLLNIIQPLIDITLILAILNISYNITKMYINYIREFQE